MNDSPTRPPLPFPSILKWTKQESFLIRCHFEGSILYSQRIRVPKCVCMCVNEGMSVCKDVYWYVCVCANKWGLCVSCFWAVMVGGRGRGQWVDYMYVLQYGALLFYVCVCVWLCVCCVCAVCVLCPMGKGDDLMWSKLTLMGSNAPSCVCVCVCRGNTPGGGMCVGVCVCVPIPISLQVGRQKGSCKICRLRPLRYTWKVAPFFTKEDEEWHPGNTQFKHWRWFCFILHSFICSLCVSLGLANRNELAFFSSLDIHLEKILCPKNRKWYNSSII